MRIALVIQWICRVDEKKIIKSHAIIILMMETKVPQFSSRITKANAFLSNENNFFVAMIAIDEKLKPHQFNIPAQ
jgi:hypothetical protein